MESIPATVPSFLWHFAKKFRFYFLGFFFIGSIWALNVSLTPYAMKLIIDAVSESHSTPDSLFAAVLLPAVFYVSLSLILGIALRFHDWFCVRTFPQLKLDITEQVFKYVELHSYSYFQQNFSGSLGNKINDIARSSSNIITQLLDHFMVPALSLIMGSVTLFLVNPYFACLLWAWCIIFIGASIFLSTRAQKYSEAFSHARSTVIGKIVDSVSNILNVKLFARESFERRYLGIYLEDSLEKDQKCLWYLLKVKGFYAFTITLLTAGMMALLIYERSKNTITIGDFALVLTLNMYLIEEVFYLANQLVPFSEEVGTCKQALSIISPKHEIVDLPGAKALKVAKGEIVFDQVTFKYKKGQRVFENKSITILPGQKVGLVGFSGSGKSTFVNLILRFFDLNSGRILIDGQDIKNVTQESLRSQIALIPQDPVLFHRTLAQNIRYGRLDATEDDVIEASKKAHCHEFVEKMSEKYHTLVGERGIRLSGGQRQRIAIARAILKNAPILILDEATSSLDSVTENYIQESLNHLMEGRTTLVVAHRLSTLYHMDRVLVFNEGKIIEDGTHAELIEINGHYARLWGMQAGGFLKEAEDADQEDEEP